MYIYISPQEQLLDDNRFAESKMQDELAACLHEQEVRIREQMRQQFESLAEEKRRIESLYRQEAEKVLSDDDRELLDSLLLEKEHLQKVDTLTGNLCNAFLIRSL